MLQRTWGDCKSEIAEICGVSGMSITDARLLVRANTAQEELSQEGEWPNIVDRWHFVATDGHIVLPTFMDRLLQINIAGCPQTIPSPWFQFSAYGPGTPDDSPLPQFGKYWCDERMINEIGEFPVQTDLPETGGPWYLRVYTAVDEGAVVTDGTSAPPVCTIQGLDGNGQIIRTQPFGSWVNGEQVPLNYAVTYVQTVNQFSSITAFTKPATNGPIKLTSWDGTTETVLANYLFSDTTPSYHHYFSRWLQQVMQQAQVQTMVVRARCRKRYVPIVEDTDVMMISNLNALAEMVIAQWKRRSDNLQSYATHKQTSVDLMKKEANSYRERRGFPA